MASSDLVAGKCSETDQAASMAVPGADGRVHYLDNLRALAMLLGVFLHGAFAYARPAQSVWLATDSRSSLLVDASIWFIHLFRMSLFFLISGYFASLTMERYGRRKFLTKRLVRIGVPLVLFYPVLLVSMTLVILFAVRWLQEPQGLIGLIRDAEVQGLESGREERAGTMHLWFLYYLLFLTLLTPVALWIRIPVSEVLNQRPWLWLVPASLLVFGAMLAGVPLPAPESFVPQLWPFMFYGLFYVAGWQLQGKEKTLDVLYPWRLHLLIASLVLFIPYYWTMPVLDLKLFLTEAPEPAASTRLLLAALTALLSVLLTVTANLYGQQLLARKHAGLRLLADSSYWVYLIHLPVVIFLQTLLIPVDCSLWIKLATVTLGTWLFCMASYLAFVRYTPLGWLLHGRRTFP
jgi:glucans biosynthesis protein C